MAVAPVTRALNARADVHLRRGDLTAARTDAEHALAISRKLQNTKPHSSLTGLSLLQLADIEAAAGNSEQAASLAVEAYEQLEASLDGQHPEALRARRLAGQLGLSGHQRPM